MNDLATSWTRTARRVAAVGDLAGVGAKLLSRYAEAHRHYHDTSHLASVLSHVDELAEAAHDPDVVRVAAWFHDAIYDPERSDNEELSAQLAEQLLSELDVAGSTIEEVARLVRLTTSHRTTIEDGNGAVLVDADLAILGSDPRTYSAYRAAIRAEYQHLDDQSFRLGRGRVLHALLSHDRLYTTTLGFARWEMTARHNMLTELSRES